MLGHLVRKEVLDQLLSLRFLILTAIGASLIWFSLADGYAAYQEQLKNYRTGQLSLDERYSQLRDPRASLSEYSAMGYVLHKPPTPLSVLVRGMEPTLGQAIHAIGTSNVRMKRSPSEVGPLTGLFPSTDLGTVVQVVLSLFVLLFTYDAVCGEKQAGTLRLMGSFSVPRYRLLLAKLVGAAIPLMAAFGIPLLLGLSMLLLLPGFELAGPQWGRLALILVVFGGYLAVFLFAGILASSLTHSPGTSFVLLLVYWVVSVTLFPRLGLVLADTLRPAMSIHELQAQKEALRSEVLKQRRLKLDQWEREHLGWDTDPEIRKARDAASNRFLREGWTEFGPSWRRLSETFNNRYQTRMQLLLVLGELSPTLALKRATFGLAGTGPEREQRFLRAFWQHMGLRSRWYRQAAARISQGQADPDRRGANRWHADDMPRFVYQEEWPSEQLLAVILDAGRLCLWSLLFFAGAYFSMVRYDIR